MGPLTLVFLLCLPFCLFAQPEDKPAAEWIRSGEPLKQAWAAHWIAEQHTESLVPEMLRVLAVPLPASTSDPAEVTDAEAARLAILDAIIQMHQPAPLADLAAFVEKFPTEVLILAARSPEDHTALLLKLLDRPHNYAAFLAIGNLLAPHRDPGFAGKALQEFSVSDQIMLFSPDQDQNIGSAWAGDRVGTTPLVRQGWPQTGTYFLMVDNSRPTAMRRAPDGAPLASAPGRRPGLPGDELIADGKYRVSARRTVGLTYTDTGFQDYSSERGRTIPDRAQEFLADYLGVDAAQLPVHADETLKVAFTGDAQLRDRLRQYFAGQRAGYALLVQALIAHKYLAAENAPPLRIRAWIDDQRSMDRTQLPDIGDLTGKQ